MCCIVSLKETQLYQNMSSKALGRQTMNPLVATELTPALNVSLDTPHRRCI